MTQAPDPQFDYLVYLKADAGYSDNALRTVLAQLSASEEEGLQESGEILQSRFRAHLPELWKLAERIVEHLRQGTSAILVESLPLSRLNLAEAKLAFLAFASCIGNPNSVDPYTRKRVWEVSPRIDRGYTPTITEHNYGADLHTDSSFKQTPEQFVLFYMFNPARDAGGVSQLLSAEHLLAKLSGNDEGRECVRILQNAAWPFRVPTVFTKYRNETELEWITAPILARQLQIRFRYDLITSALERVPVTVSAEAAWALLHFHDALQQLTPLSISLKQDSLLVLNNYQILHGRTPFEDLDRLLLRIRLSTSH